MVLALEILPALSFSPGLAGQVWETARRRRRQGAMLFNSLPFLYLFLPIAYLVFWRLSGATRRYIWLAITGYAFYSFWNYKFCALMFFSTVVSYAGGLGLLRWKDRLRRRLCLIVPVTADLSLLGFFKYTNFALTSVNGLSSWLGLQTRFPA